MYSFTYLLAFFMFYAFIGWCTEVIYKTTSTGKFVNRGFLNGPLCPIYGIGVTVVIVCLTPIEENLIVLYFGSVILTSLLELVTGFILEKIFHQKWWDYSDEAFNFKGYVCLKFSLAWGLACVFVMKIIQPIVLKAIKFTPPAVQLIIFIVFYVTMLADGIITVAALAKVTFQLKLANDLDYMLNKIAETVGTKLSSGTLKSMDELQEQKEKLEDFKDRTSEFAEEQKAKLENLRGKYNLFTDKKRAKFGDDYKGTENITFVHKRLEKAYPSLNFKRIEHKNVHIGFENLKQRLADFTDRAGNVKM